MPSLSGFDRISFPIVGAVLLGLFVRDSVAPLRDRVELAHGASRVTLPSVCSAA